MDGCYLSLLSKITQKQPNLSQNSIINCIFSELFIFFFLNLSAKPKKTNVKNGCISVHFRRNYRLCSYYYSLKKIKLLEKR